MHHGPQSGAGQVVLFAPKHFVRWLTVNLVMQGDVCLHPHTQRAVLSLLRADCPQAYESFNAVPIWCSNKWH